ncbi:hypothetical protein SKC41_30835 [Mycobacterium sp. 050128]|uniref:hypothetical protein n=1 Tax=unclassified Mycobacterium TaxID=2642494 RepID=UPI002EDAC953
MGVAMIVKIARYRRWLRYTTVVAAVFWVIAVAGGCRFPAMSMSDMGVSGVRSSSISTAVSDHSGVAVVQSASVGDGSDLLIDRGCKHAVQSCATTDLVALAAVLALVLLTGSLTWPVVLAARGPPRPIAFAFPRSGRSILTRFCITRT